MFISSATQCLLAFCLPAWLTAKFASPVPSRWLYLDNAPTLKAIAGVIIVYVLALPAMNQIIEWNASIHFPQALHEVEETLRKWEESNNGITRKLLESSSIGGIITGVCIVGILTGFSEEIFFRGALQGIFVRSRIGTAISVWVAAIIFSAIHFQFFGFAPRLLLGAYFGYLLWWSRSIWIPVFVHMFNNSLVVFTTWRNANNPDTAIDIDKLGSDLSTFPSIAMVCTSIALTIIALYTTRRQCLKNI